MCEWNGVKALMKAPTSATLITSAFLRGDRLAAPGDRTHTRQTKGSMRLAVVAVFTCAGLLALVLPHARHVRPAPPHALARAGVVFEANGGRTDRRVAFVAHHGRSTLWVTKSGPVLAVHNGKRRAVIATHFVGARGGMPAGRDKLPGVVNSIVGGHTRTGIATY